MIRLHGLNTVVGALSGDQQESAADVHWDRHVIERLENRPTSVAFQVHRADGVWTRHIFTYQARTFCEFLVSSDGRRVISHALPIVPDRDLLGLFAEPVMRTILRCWGIISFHGAALQRNGNGVLLLGSSGAGKSTLAAALVQQGWTLLTDDLTRVVSSGGQWSIVPGFRQLKLWSDTVDSLGYRTRAIERHSLWPVGTEPAPGLNKYIVQWDPADRTENATLDAIYALGPRELGVSAARITRLSPIDQFRTLVSNVSPDAINPASAPPREAIAAAGSILRQVDVRSLVLPDDLSRLIEASAQLPTVNRA